MIKEGIELMIVGMAVVFAFLILLVGCMSLAAKLLARFPEDEPEPAPAPPSTPTKSPSSALIAAAVAAAQRTRDQAN